MERHSCCSVLTPSHCVSTQGVYRETRVSLKWSERILAVHCLRDEKLLSQLFTQPHTQEAQGIYNELIHTSISVDLIQWSLMHSLKNECMDIPPKSASSGKYLLRLKRLLDSQFSRIFFQDHNILYIDIYIMMYCRQFFFSRNFSVLRDHTVC